MSEFVDDGGDVEGLEEEEDEGHQGTFPFAKGLGRVT